MQTRKDGEDDDLEDVPEPGEFSADYYDEVGGSANSGGDDFDEDRGDYEYD